MRLSKFLRLTSLFWLFLALLSGSSALGAFGLTTTTNYYQVDTGSTPSLVFKIRRTEGGSTTSIGDIMSLVYNGVEYQDQTRGSQVNSGFDFLGYATTNVTLNAEVVNTDYIKITVTTDGLTHYYMARNGDPCIYMGTYFTEQPVTGGALCRYILRTQIAKLTNGPTPSDIRGVDESLESGDIFLFSSANTNTALIGQTRSKHYSGIRLKDWTYIGANNSVTSPTAGLWVVRDNQEGGSGGPFYKSLLNQGTDTNQEITYIVNYGEGQTESFRKNILNTYTLVFTNGAAPGPVDTSWFSGMGLTGYVAPSGRGTVICAGISNRDCSYVYTVGFANSTAQYFTTASATDGSFTMSGMLSGTYTMKVYKNEFAVYTDTNVVVSAGGTTTHTPIAITAATNTDVTAGDPSRTVPLWRIGNWDGTPNEFLHADKVTTMHPSDVRITGTNGTAAWAPGPYVIGTSSPATGMPCYQWKSGVNGNQVVQFNLPSGAPTGACTVRIGITCGFAGGRPNIALNSWSNTNLPSAVTQPDSRTLTVGVYRGNNKMYTFSVPSGTLVAGLNTLTISVISGSSGTTYLSPGYSIDCVDMFVGTASSLNLPGIPTGVSTQTTTGDNSRTITLSWNATSGATSYEIRRATSANGPFTVVASALTALTWTDTDVAAKGTYFYLLSALNSSGKGMPAAISIDIDGPPRPAAALTWTGSASSIWDLGTANWTYAGGSTYFHYPEDSVRFDDTSSAINVTLSGTLTPASVNVSSTKNYAFSGTGFISGPASLTKTGNGTLTLSNNANNYSGSTTIGGGTLVLGSNASFSTGGIGTGGITFEGGTLNHSYSSANTLVYANTMSVNSGQTGRIITPERFRLNGAVTGTGTLNMEINTAASRADFQNSFAGFSGIFNLTGTGTVRLGINALATGQPVFQSIGWADTTLSVDGVTILPSTNGGGNTILIGALTSTGATGTLDRGTAGTATYSIGAKNLNTTYAGKITGNAALTKTGSGSLTLSGANTYTGATFVSSGSLLVTGSLATTAVSVSKDATIGGTGTLGGNLTLASGARLALGVDSSATKGLTVSGTSTLNGAITVVPALLGGTLAPGTYTLLTYSGSLAGSSTPTFLWNDTTFSGYVATFSTATAGQVRITLALPSTPPAAPSGLVAFPADAQVTLSWDSAPGATSYTLLRSTTSGSGYAVIASDLTTNSYTNTNLANGTTYYYVVAAKNASGSSGNSNEAGAKPVQTYSQWATAAFPGQFDPNTVGVDADPDGDGSVNLVEYFCGNSPSTPNAGYPITCTLDDQSHIVMTFPMSKNLSGVSYTVQQSTKLDAWADTNVTPTVASDQGAVYLMSVTLPQGTATKLFLRLSVTSH